MAPLTTVDAPSARDLAELCETQLAEAQLHRRAGNPAGALATARAARDEAERARALEPQTARYGELAAVCQRCIARLLRQDEHVDESVASYRRATATWSKLAFEHPATPRLKADLMKTWRELADYQRGLGRVEEAEWTERRINRYLAEMPRALGEDFFQLAIVYAQLAAPPGDDDPAPELDHETRRNDDCQRAVDALSEALKLGFQPQIQLSTHPLLVHLVARDDFRQLAARARAQFDSDRVSTRPHDSHVDAQPDLHLRLLMLASQIGIAEVLDETGQRQEALQVLERNVAQVDELTPQQPDNNIAIMAAKGNALYAIADAHWRARRYLPAKRAWDQGFALLQEAHAAAPETKRAELARTISQHELDLIDVYGGVGAWREAGIHRGRYIAFDQIATAAVEARYSFLTLVAEAGESYEAACRYVLERHATEDPSHTAWLLSLAEQHVLDPAELVELAKQQEKSAEPSWFNTVVGYCQRRAGEGVAALRNLDPGVWAQFDRALALSQSGDDHGARLLMDIAESSYASLMRDWLASAQLRDANGQARVNDFWWEMIRLQLIRAEARRVIAQEAEADPWAALLEARAAVIVGDAERAEAAFRQAVELAPDDARVWATRAETRAVLQQTKLTESDFAQALQLEPQNPEWWIARGKYHLEHGRDVEADADYQRAAELSPNDLDVFLRTGVWAVGPYPAAMNQSFAVEGQPHPSRAVTAQGSGGEESLEPYSWIRIPIHRLGNNWGEVALNDITQRSANVSAYALGFVYATQARTASLMVSSGQHLRLWINGVCVYDDPNSTESFELLDRIPISLQRGRNSILVRISTKAPNCSFMMRLADCPSERALTAARLMQWPEAVAAFEKLPAQQLVTSGHYWAIYCKCLAAAQYGERLEEAIRVEYPLRRYTSNEFAVTELLRAGTMFPATAITSEQWRELAEEAGQPTRSWQKIAKGRGLYRGGALADAVDYYKRQPELADDWEALAVVAMAYHRLGRSDQASQTLQSLNNKFQKWAEARVNATGFVVPGPMTSAHRWALLVEANRVVRGVEMTADPIYARLRQKITAELEAIRLELEDHDLALMFKPDDPRLFAARAQRFAELSRWDEAEADFQTATQLKPDPFVWLALGRYWELRDNTKQSAVAYLRAIELDRAQDWDQLIRKRLTSNEPLFQSILKARPMDADLWTLRGEQLCADGRWGEAAQVWAQRITQGQNDAFSLYQLALLQAGAGDPDAVRETCRTMAERLAVEEPAQATNFMAWACAVSPGALADYGSALESARRFTNANLASAFAHETLGALLLRSGQFVKALEELTTANELNDASEQLTTTSPAYVWYLLAITHGRMGNADEARQWFDKATRWVERAAKEQEQGTRAPWPWNRRLTLELLQREAAQAAPSVSAQKAATP